MESSLSFNDHTSSGNPHLRSSQAVLGYHARVVDGNLGRITDFVVEAQSWKITNLVVDTGSWLPPNEILLPVALVGKIDWQNSSVKLNIDKKASEYLNGYNPSDGINILHNGVFDYYGRPAGKSA